MNDFTDEKPHTATNQDVAAMNQFRRFQCNLCGHEFKDGDIYRFVFANGTPNADCVNFFVCEKCDGDDVLRRGAASFQQAIQLAKRWKIYGPD